MDHPYNAIVYYMSYELYTAIYFGMNVPNIVYVVTHGTVYR